MGRETLDTLSKRSPTMLEVTLEQLRRGATLTSRNASAWS